MQIIDLIRFKVSESFTHINKNTFLKIIEYLNKLITFPLSDAIIHINQTKFENPLIFNRIGRYQTVLIDFNMPFFCV